MELSYYHFHHANRHLRPNLPVGTETLGASAIGAGTTVAAGPLTSINPHRSFNR